MKRIHWFNFCLLNFGYICDGERNVDMASAQQTNPFTPIQK